MNIKIANDHNARKLLNRKSDYQVAFYYNRDWARTLSVNTVKFGVKFKLESPSNLTKKTHGMWDGNKPTAYGKPVASDLFEIDMATAYKTNAYSKTRTCEENKVENSLIFDFSTPSMVRVNKADILKTREVKATLYNIKKQQSYRNDPIGVPQSYCRQLPLPRRKIGLQKEYIKKESA